MDYRDRAARMNFGYYSHCDFNERNMTLNFSVNDESFTFPVVYVVCDVCGGKGRYTNPSIDSDGITASEFNEWADDEREGYFSGRYDIPCACCRGKRVVPAIDFEHLNDDERKHHKLLLDQECELEGYELECESERRMGA